MESATQVPALVASTGTAYSCSVLESQRREDAQSGATRSESLRDVIEDESNYFKGAQWYRLLLLALGT